MGLYAIPDNLQIVTSPFARENVVLARLAKRFGNAPAGQVWVGDDAALLDPLSGPLFATDLVVEGVHVDRRWCSPVDIGWKAVSVNVSDIAAMGGEPRAIVVSLAGASSEEIDQLMDGAVAASERYGCAIVGGDISDGATLTVAVAIIGEATSNVVLRSGACAGDRLYVTGPLGGAASGLRSLRADHSAEGDHVQAQRRPIARVEEGKLFAELGANAMIDCSDGLSTDVDRLATASRVGVVLNEVPYVSGATLEDALFGGEDYELIVGISSAVDVVGAFVREGLRPPILIGNFTADVTERILDGTPFRPRGYEHQLGGDR